MSDRAIAMKLILSELEQPEEIESLQDRKRLQKLVYLAQAVGVNLGYRFGWYIKGPYSSELANDYYNMPEPATAENVSLLPEVAQQLLLVKAVIDSPLRPQALELADWLETVASVHFLRSSSRLNYDGIVGRFSKEKPHLLAFVGAANTAVEQHLGGQAQAN